MTDLVTASSRVQDFISMTKPRVILLMLVCSLVGMLLATPPVPPISLIVFGILGIALVAGSAAVVNHVADAQIDRTMARTDTRPIATGRIRIREGLVFAGLLGTAGLVILFFLVNPLSAWLNFASWIGYAVIYTMYLKHATSQNIVLGGLFGAAPPLLGWTAVTNSISLDAILLVLIIFLWTPPHFWALALDRRDEYAKARVPMLPNTHGVKHTSNQIFWYTLVLVIASAAPSFWGSSGLVYLCCAALLGGAFVAYALALRKRPYSGLTQRTFKFSIVYLNLLFCAVLVDHYVGVFGLLT
ncbi:MAG: heme o synthase [Gammaproteobacteria bacterium]|nr:heme o synthase [Gammaproteobacteria bacterium]